MYEALDSWDRRISVPAQIPDILPEAERRSWLLLLDDPLTRAQVREAFWMQRRNDRGTDWGSSQATCLAEDSRYMRLLAVLHHTEGLLELETIFIEAGCLAQAAECRRACRAEIKSDEFVAMGDAFYARGQYGKAIVAYKKCAYPDVILRDFVAILRLDYVTGRLKDMSAHLFIECVKEASGTVVSTDELIKMGFEAVQYGLSAIAEDLFGKATGYVPTPDMNLALADLEVRTISMGGEQHEVDKITRVAGRYISAGRLQQAQKLIDMLIQCGRYSAVEGLQMTILGVKHLPRSWYVQASHYVSHWRCKIDCLKKGECVEELIVLCDSLFDSVHDDSRVDLLHALSYEYARLDCSAGIIKVADEWSCDSDRILEAAELYARVGHVVPEVDYYHRLGLAHTRKGNITAAVSALAEWVRRGGGDDDGNRAARPPTGLVLSTSVVASGVGADPEGERSVLTSVEACVAA